MSEKLNRIFIPGSEWLYFKVYVNCTLGDRLLYKELYRATRNILKQHASSFFFIRYQDPDFHIRLRFRLASTGDMGAVISSINAVLAPYLRNRQIGKLQIDTYSREIERYGLNTMADCESIFFHDSISCMQLLRKLHQNNTPEIRGIIGLMQIDRFLSDFGLNITEKKDLLDHMAISFKREFAIDTEKERAIHRAYRDNKHTIVEALETPSLFCKKCDSILSRRSKQIVQVSKSIDMKLTVSERNILLHSLIHMMMNRLHISSHRKNEAISYCVLSKYYSERLAREKYGNG